MGITAFPFSSVIDVPAARILGRDDAGTGSAEALTNTEIFAILATGTPSASTYLRGDGTWSAVSAGVGGSTSSVDNAVLRADGTVGATLQASSIVVPDNFTSSPNATVNHASIQATGDTTNVSVSVVPKGTGSFSLQVPDGTAAGGNARGANSVDLSTTRSAATQVASGSQSFVAPCGGTASGIGSISLGGTAAGTNSISHGSAGTTTASGASSVTFCSDYTTASGARSFACCGDFLTVSGAFAFGHGAIPGIGGATVAGDRSFGVAGGGTTTGGDNAFAHGPSAVSRLRGMRAFASGRFAANGDVQGAEIVLRNTTTTDSAVTLFVNGSSERLTIPSGKICQFLLIITGVRNGGADVAVYMRRVTIKNIGGTTSLVGAVDTIGTDQATGTSIAITADDANDALQIAPTGVSGQTWRWKCVVYGGEIGHG